MGVTWKLPLSVFSTLVATSRSEYPPCEAFVRSTPICKRRIIEGLLNTQISQPRYLHAVASISLSAICLLAFTSLPSN